MPISRLFHSVDNARAAVADLQAAGFGNVGVHVFGPAAGPADAVAIERQGVPASKARLYAERVAAGESLVVVQAPLGFGSMVTEILERRRPDEDVPVASTHETRDHDDAAPFSAALNWKTLLRNPAPFSSWLGWRTLSERQTPNVALKSGDPAPLSRKLGWPALSDDPAPLSKRAGWNLLSGDPAPLSKRLGWSVLSSDPAPLSKRTGWRVLWKDPAPFSSRLGWRVLSDDPAPFSRLLGWRVLADQPKRAKATR